MSSPFRTSEYSDKLHGAVHEIINAMSALNMEPQPLGLASKGSYLSETDFWARHAMEHLHRAVELLGQAQSMQVHQPSVYDGISDEEKKQHHAAQVAQMMRDGA